MRPAHLTIAFVFACNGGGGGNPGDDGSGKDGSTDDGGHDLALGCKAAPPGGAKLAAAPKPYAGTCPTIPAVTTQDIVIMSSGNARKFWVVVPADFQPQEKLPVIFLWHWLGGSAQDFFDRGSVQEAVDQQRFIAVIPQAKGDLQFTWPATALDSAARLDEDAQFFDDMLSCVSSQL